MRASPITKHLQNHQKIIIESNVIIEYLDDVFPEKSLRPKNSYQRALMRLWLDLAETMNASKWRVLRYIRIPSAMPALASGFRVATAVAPIGAIVGEWVGSSEGLGYLMLHANGRMQIDVMFAALFTLSFMAIALYYTVDTILTRALSWSPETRFNLQKDE